MDVSLVILFIAGLIFTDRIKTGELYQRIALGEGLRVYFICSAIKGAQAFAPAYCHQGQICPLLCNQIAFKRLARWADALNKAR